MERSVAASSARLRVLVAPDSFKGSIAAPEAALAIAAGLLRAASDLKIDLCPIADGGEGTAAALVAAMGGRVEHRTVAGPLGDPVVAAFAVLGDGRTTVVESAAAAGLGLVPHGLRDPRHTSTYGVGELVRGALDLGLPRLVVGAGGSATNDGGAGSLVALGARLLDNTGQPLPPGGAALARLDRIDASGLDPRLRGVELLVACDVDNPLCGPEGATAVFGPQKGASPAVVAELDEALCHYARVLARDLGVDMASRPRGGAAGGLAAALHAVCGAQLVSGVELVLATAAFEQRLKGISLVITGEGRLDLQTLRGKAPLGVALAARRAGAPVVCLAGGVEAVPTVFDAVLPIAPGPITLQEAIERGAELLASAAERLWRLMALGSRLGAPRNPRQVR